MSVTEASSWEAQEEELESITSRRASLAGRAEHIRARISRLPAIEAQARSKALEAGEDSWETVKPFAQERRDLEEELNSIKADETSLRVEATRLKEEVQKPQGHRDCARGQRDPRRSPGTP